jgi:hypothetical protein
MNGLPLNLNRKRRTSSDSSEQLDRLPTHDFRVENPYVSSESKLNWPTAAGIGRKATHQPNDW